MDEVFQRFLRQSGPVLCLDIGSVTQDVVLAHHLIKLFQPQRHRVLL